MKDLHTYGKSLHDALGHGARHARIDGIDAVRRQRGCQGGRPRRSSGRRTACSGPARASRSSSSPRPATPTPRPRPAQTYGGFGGIFRSTAGRRRATRARSRSSSAATPTHTGLDNIAFFDRTASRSSRTTGDALHTQLERARLGVPVRRRRGLRDAATQPLRFLAEGRDPSATIDSYLLDSPAPASTNEGDNEITGIHVSNGDPSSTACSARQARSRSTTAGGCSGRSSTATT